MRDKNTAIAKVRAKAERMAKESIGCDFRVRRSKNEIFTGKITECFVEDVVVSGNSVFAYFKVRINRLPWVRVRRIPAF